jgi:hypothetical protein
MYTSNIYNFHLCNVLLIWYLLRYERGGNLALFKLVITTVNYLITDY